MNGKRWMCFAVVAMVALICGAAVVLGCGGEGGDEEADSFQRTFREETAAEKAGIEPQVEETYADEAGGAETRSSWEGGLSSAPESSTLPQLQFKVIKTALVELEAEKGDYAKIRQDAVAISDAAGGYLEGENANRDDDGFTYATLTLRIPADRFDEAVEDISTLGEVVSTEVSTSDVSAEYVDLESRLRHLQAEEAFYLGLIGEAQNVQEMITIREHLSAIQLEKERVQGRMNFLDQQVGYSTLTLAVDEIAPDEDGEGFWDSVADAFKSFGRGLKKLAIGFFYALPYILIIAVIIVLVWMLVRRSRKRRPGESSGV